MEGSIGRVAGTAQVQAFALSGHDEHRGAWTWGEPILFSQTVLRKRCSDKLGTSLSEKKSSLSEYIKYNIMIHGP